MTEEADGSITKMFRQFREGDRSAAQQLWERFFPRLLRLAAKTLNGRPQRVADADDALQNSFFRFFRQSERGDFGENFKRDDLWNVLAVITIREALKQTRRESAQKRGGYKVNTEADLLSNRHPASSLDDLVGASVANEAILGCQELLMMLEPKLRANVLLKLMGYYVSDIASILECSERSVKRNLSRVRQIWNDHVAN